MVSVPVLDIFDNKTIGQTYNRLLRTQVIVSPGERDINVGNVTCKCMERAPFQKLFRELGRGSRKQISSILFHERKIATVKIDFDVPFKECVLIFTVIQSSRKNNTEKLIKSITVLRLTS